MKQCNGWVDGKDREGRQNTTVLMQIVHAPGLITPWLGPKGRHGAPAVQARTFEGPAMGWECAQ